MTHDLIIRGGELLDGTGADAMRANGGGRQEQLRGGDGFPAGRVVLPGPELVVAESVEVLDEVEVTLELKGWAFTHQMMGCQEGTKAERHGSGT